MSVQALRSHLVRLSAVTAISGSVLSFSGCNSTIAAHDTSGLVPSAANSAHSNVAVKFRHGGPTGTFVSVDLRPYLAALTAVDNPLGGNMLCEASPRQDHCITSIKDTAGEARIYYSLGNKIVDYIAIGSHDFQKINGSSTKRIGVIRNHDPSGQLRCFTVNTSDVCQSPAARALGPPYLIPYLPVVSEDILNAASNSDGSPKEPIPGALVDTPDDQTGDYWTFGIQNMTVPGCVQSSGGGTQTRGHVVYVTGVHFQGTVGKQDAIVVDGDSGHSSSSDHIERYFYVLGLGRVREGVAWYNPQDGFYDNTPHYNEVRSNEMTLDTSIFNIEPAECPQGSAVPLWPSTLRRR